jgi:tetratricopeptide (TPR) repeat protein
MKIAVYCITKNEEQFMKRWAESAADADYLVVADTGSSDDTVKVARKAGAIVHTIGISPWRFEDARNASLALIPLDADLCIALDADEILMPGWRAQLEMVDPSVTRPRYKYTWSWNEDGTPGLTYGGDKIHKRHGYRWKHPVHEVLVPNGEEVQGWCGLEIHHHPDNSKSRAQYLPLLELAVREDPSDDRNAHYLGREYFNMCRYTIAAHELKRHLALPKSKWPAERAKSMRMLAACLPDEAETWLLRACAEDPTQRDQWVDLAQHYYATARWQDCYAAAQRALSITGRNLSYINEAASWGYLPWDLLAISAFRLGRYAEAVEYGEQALELAPNDDRLQANLKWYQDALV